MNRETLHEAVSLWQVARADAEDVVRVACDLLVAGLDGPAMCELAAVSIAHADRELPAVLEPALRGVDLTYHERGSLAAQEAGLVAVCARVVAGAESPRCLTTWAHRVFGHDGIDLAQRLVELDDCYDLAHGEAAVADVDALVLAEARRIAGD